MKQERRHEAAGQVRSAHILDPSKTPSRSGSRGLRGVGTVEDG